MQWGQTPLWTASFDGHEKCVQLLIEAKASTDVPRKVVSHHSYTHSTTTSTLSVCTGSHSHLKMTQDGVTALHVASHNGHSRVVRMLLEAKADVKKKTKVSAN